MVRRSKTRRLVFRLRFYEELPFAEVARRVGVTVVNARVLMVRATERLKKELAEYKSPEPNVTLYRPDLGTEVTARSMPC